MSQPGTWGCPRVADAPKTPEAMADRIDDSFDALLSSHAGGSRPSYALAGMVWYNSTDGDLKMYDGTSDWPIGLKVDVPSGNAEAGMPGFWACDNSYLYIYTGDGTTHTWGRIAHNESW